MVDKMVLEDPKNSPFPLYDGHIKTYLQLFWDPRKNEIYDDCAVNAYGPNMQFMPLRDDIDLNLYPDSEIKIHPDAGCWWEKVKQRLDMGSLKKIIIEKFGKDNESFAHYFKRKNRIE